MKQLIVNSSLLHESAVVLENRKLEDFLYENKKEYSYVGNIYKCKISDILPGMQAAFVDIGLEKKAYFYIDNILSEKFLNEKKIKKSEILGINDVVKKGEELMVQVIRDPIGSKNISVSTEISIPGKFLALLPGSNRINISKKINDKIERKRLEEIGHEIYQNNYGMIIRTSALGVDKELINQEYIELLQIYKKIEREFAYSYAPKILRGKSSFIEKLLIDGFMDNVDEIYVEGKERKKYLDEISKKYFNKSSNKIKICDNAWEIYNLMDIEKQIDSLNNRKIELDNGGSIFIDTVEAMTVIDVNTGSYVGKNEQHEDTSLTANLYALDEIARQIRLRNISGIIIIDFIDMHQKSNIDLLLERAKEIFQKDRAKVKVFGMTRLSLMEVTRKKDRESFFDKMNTDCSICGGSGKTPSLLMITIKLENIIEKILHNTSCKNILLACNDSIFNTISTKLSDTITMLEEKSGLQIDFIIDKELDNSTIKINKLGNKD